MPKVSELRKAVEDAVEDNIPPSKAIGWFNSALRDLAMVARIPSKVLIPIPPDSTITEVTLPTDIVELREVTVEFDGMEPLALEDAGYGLKIYENASIEWRQPLPSGRFVSRYYRYPVMLANETDIPEIGLPFHDALTHYATCEYYLADDETELARLADNKYQGIKAQLDEHTSKRGTSAPRRSDPRPSWARGRR
jgi:hypothetical protein